METCHSPESKTVEAVANINCVVVYTHSRSLQVHVFHLYLNVRSAVSNLHACCLLGRILRHLVFALASWTKMGTCTCYWCD